MNGYRIRTAEERDIDRLTELDALCFSMPWSREAFHQELCENPLAFYMVLESEDNVIGYAGLWMILSEGHITNVAVEPAMRRKGLAELLLRELFQQAGDRGIQRFTLEVRPSNVAANGLYEKLGFVVMGRRKQYCEDNGEDALILWRG